MSIWLMNKRNVQVTDEQVIEKAQEIKRRSKRQRRPTITSNFIVYSLEHKCELSIDEDLVLFKQVNENDNLEKWSNFVKEELKSMDYNKVWNLVNA